MATLSKLLIDAGVPAEDITERLTLEKASELASVAGYDLLAGLAGETEKETRDRNEEG
jgi:hypothetical protein